MVAGLGVRGDAHFGAAVGHRSRVAADPTQPNLRQVHLIHGELSDELQSQGFDVGPGVMGENVTTRGIDLLALPVGTILPVGGTALLALTGLRNPCLQLNGHRAGLLNGVLHRAADGKRVRKAGGTAVVLASSTIRPGDVIRMALPPNRIAPWTGSDRPHGAAGVVCGLEGGWKGRRLLPGGG